MDLSVTFFGILVPLAACGFILRHGIRWFVPALALQSLVLAAAGERTPVLAVLAITAARGVGGRAEFTTGTGLAGRTAALASGVTSGTEVSGQPQQPGLLAQAATRLHDNSFTAGILQARHLGYPLMSPAAVPESLTEVIPSALWPSKLSRGNALSPAQAEINGFGLQDINFLPSLPGLYVGFLPWPWLLVLMAAAGAAWGRGERWLLREVTPVRLVMLAATAAIVAQYQAGLPAMLVTLRAGAVVAVAVKVLEVIRSRRTVMEREMRQIHAEVWANPGALQ